MALRERVTDFITRFIAIDETSVVFDTLGAKALKLGRNIAPANIAIDNFGNKSKNAAKGAQTLSSAMGKVITWGIVTGIIYGTVKALKDQITVMRDVEYELANIKVLSSETGAVYKNLEEQIFSLAGSYGASASEIAKAIKVWVQQGRSINESLVLTESSLMAVNITGLSSVEVTEDMTAALFAFKLESSEAVSILDKWTKTAAVSAVEVSTLAGATKRAAETAGIAGLKIDEFNGLVVAMGEASRMSGEQIGTALKTIISRVYKEQSREALKAMADIQVYTDTTETNYKNLGVVLDELYLKWQKMDRQEKIDLAYKVAGIRMGNQFITMMNHYDRGLAATTASLTSQGYAARANALIMQTQNKTIAQLRVELQRLGKMIMEIGAWNFLSNAIVGMKQLSSASRDIIKVISSIIPIFKGAEGAAIAFSIALGVIGIAIAAISAMSLNLMGVLGGLIVLIVGTAGAVGSWRNKTDDLIKSQREQIERQKKIDEFNLQFLHSVDGLIEKYNSLAEAMANSGEDSEYFRAEMDRIKDALISLQKEAPALIGKLDFSKLNYQPVRDLVLEIRKLSTSMEEAALRAQMMMISMELSSTKISLDLIEKNKKLRDSAQKIMKDLAGAANPTPEQAKVTEQIREEYLKQFKLKYPLANLTHVIAYYEKQIEETTKGINEADELGLNTKRLQLEAQLNLLRAQKDSLGEMDEGLNKAEELNKKFKESIDLWLDIKANINDAVTKGIEGMIDKTSTWQDALRDVGNIIRHEIIQSLVESSGIVNSIKTMLSSAGLINPFGGISAPGAAPFITNPPKGVTVPGGIPIGSASYQQQQAGGAGLGIMSAIGSIIPPLMLTMGIMQMAGLGDVFSKKETGHFNINDADITVDEVNLYAKRVVPIGWFSGSTLTPKTVVYTSIDVNVKGTDKLLEVTANRASKNMRVQEERF